MTEAEFESTSKDNPWEAQRQRARDLAEERKTRTTTPTTRAARKPKSKLGEATTSRRPWNTEMVRPIDPEGHYRIISVPTSTSPKPR